MSHDIENCDCVACLVGKEQTLRLINDKIKEHKYAVLYVAESKPCFGYTVGLEQSFGVPEFIIVGFNQKITYMILNAAIELLKEDIESFNKKEIRIQIKDKTSYTQFNIGCKHVDSKHYSRDDSQFPLLWNRICSKNGKYRVKQIILPDKDERLPWDENYDIHYSRSQTLLYKPRLCGLKDCNVNNQLLFCSGCMEIAYCCPQHQIEDWKRHKLTCSKMIKETKVKTRWTVPKNN